MPVSLPSEIPMYLRKLVNRSGKRHNAIGMAWSVADHAQTLSDRERMEAMSIAEQICMLTLLAWDEENPPDALERLLEEARQVIEST